MRILFAYNIITNDNEFVRAHIRILGDMGYEVTASLEEFWHPTQKYEMVVINWPDYFYKWRTDIKDEEVIRFKNAMDQIKLKGISILTFFHDEYSHFSRGANLNLLFDICYRQSDCIVHLGNYSADKYRMIYTDAEHYIIHHPLYTEFDTTIPKETSRNNLSIKADEYLVVVPGAIRAREEITYAIEVFRNLPFKKKRMVFLRTSHLSRPKFFRSFIDLKTWIYFLVNKSRSHLENIVFLNGFMKKEMLSQWFATADLIIIPRTGILNSGNITLGAQFGKPMIGTGAGNMKEILGFLEQLCILPDEEICEKKLEKSLNSKLKDEKSIQKKIIHFAGDSTIKEQWKRILK